MTAELNATCRNPACTEHGHFDNDECWCAAHGEWKLGNPCPPAELTARIRVALRALPPCPEPDSAVQAIVAAVEPLLSAYRDVAEAAINEAESHRILHHPAEGLDCCGLCGAVDAFKTRVTSPTEDAGTERKAR